MQHQSSEDARAVLADLRQLRYSREAKSNFWASYCMGVAHLCRSAMAMVLSKRVTDDSWVVAASYGLDHREEYSSALMRSAVSLAGRARANGFAFERPELSGLDMRQPVALVVSLQIPPNEDESIIVLLLDRNQSQQFNELLVRVQLVSDVPASYFAHAANVAGSRQKSERNLPDVLEMMSMIIHQQQFVLACMTLVNELSSRFSCTQVSIGWKKADYVKAVAISHLERIEKTTDAVQEVESIFEESFDQDEEIVWPQDEHGSTIIVAHERYAYDNKLSQLISLPLRVDGSPIAVITCEIVDGTFSENELMTLRLLTSQISPWLNEIYQRDRWWGGRLLLKLKSKLSWWLGVEHTWIKLLALLGSAALLYIFFASWQYRVEASASMATDNLAYISAPYSGYVHDVKVHAGDEVKEDAVLLTLDKEELFLKTSEISADVRRFTGESEKARAARAFSDMRIADARVEQANAELERVQYYLKQSDIRAPFDGIIVEGDKEQLLGAPLNKGDLIFKIAQLKGLYVTLRVPERDIDAIEIGQQADLVLLSRPGFHIPLKITQIVPVAKVEEGEGNVFSVKATLTEDSASWWHPGMKGVAKIEVGERSLLWVLTHRTTDFLQMYFWW